MQSTVTITDGYTEYQVKLDAIAHLTIDEAESLTNIDLEVMQWLVM
ncbi:hypothetical protein AB4345_05320 [Vibrio breoganii]